MKTGINIIYETRAFDLSWLRVACLRSSGRYHSIGAISLDLRGLGEAFSHTSRLQCIQQELVDGPIPNGNTETLISDQ